MVLESYIERYFAMAYKIGIPDFGVFISEKYPIQYDKSKGIMEPPKTVWKFQQKPPSDKDYRGFVDFVSKGENISREEGLEFIKKAVVKWKDALEKDHQTKLSDADILYKDSKDGKIKYMSLQDKLHGDFFGLKPVIIKEKQRVALPSPKSKDEPLIVVEQGHKPYYEDAIEDEGDDTTSVIYRVGWMVAATTAVAFAIFLLQFNGIVDFYKIFS